MILNIVKNGTDSSSILECVKKTFNSSKVNIKTDYEISVDIEYRFATTPNHIAYVEDCTVTGSALCT